VFGAGGGTSSYTEIEETDLIVLWGSNAREAHPIFFHHLMKGLNNGARMFAVDPRRTSSAKFADLWLGLNVGTDIALSNAVGRHIIANNWHNTDFIAHSTSGFEAYAESVESYTLERASTITGVPGGAIAELAEAYANAETAQILWTLGITEHHNAVENVLSLCNLSLLTGHIGRWGSGLVPLRGQNNVQGGGDMGALPNKFPGFQDVTDDTARAKFEAVYGTSVPVEPGLHLTLMFEAMATKDLRAVYCIGENPADSEADVAHARKLLGDLDLLVVQDIFMTRTAELADVVFPASIGWAESDGTVTSSERRVQRVRAAVPPPGEARDDVEIIAALANRMGADWGSPTPAELWDELRSLSPMHAGMSWERLEAEGGLQWPCPSLDHPGSPFLHGWLWEEDLGGRDPAPLSVVEHAGPKDELTDEFPLRLTTGRSLDSFNTGVQSGSLKSPVRYGEAIDVSEADAAHLAIGDGEVVRVVSPRGAVEMPVRIMPGLAEGLTFTTFHFPDLVDVNVLTNDAWDPRSGTAEFKAASIRIEKITPDAASEIGSDEHGSTGAGDSNQPTDPAEQLRG
jgi:formate dehydrogenase major subunit